MKIDMNLVRKHIPKTQKQSDNLYNNYLSPLINESYEFMGNEMENLYWEKPDWEDYKNEYSNWERASKKYQKAKAIFYKEGGFNPYPDYLKSSIWKDACHYIVADKIFQLNGLICEYCNEEIKERNGFCYCIVHHQDYDNDIFDDVMLVHIDCHKKIHGLFEESKCKKCGEGTNSSWKEYCVKCYFKR